MLRSKSYTHTYTYTHTKTHVHTNLHVHIYTHHTNQHILMYTHTHYTCTYTHIDTGAEYRYVSQATTTSKVQQPESWKSVPLVPSPSILYSLEYDIPTSKTGFQDFLFFIIIYLFGCNKS